MQPTKQMTKTTAPMTNATRSLALSLSVVLGGSFFASTANAEEPKPAGTLPAEPPEPVPASERPDLARKPDSRLTGETPPDGGGRVFRQLSGEAYPEGNGRGIYGGSLWFSPFHGLQWPYMPQTGMGFSGSVWLDPGYARFNSGIPSVASFRRYLQQGRFVFRVTPTWSDGSYFVQGQGEAVLNKEQQLGQPNTADADDVFIRAGKWNKYDVQVGRFDVWEVYHFGMGLDLNTLERGGASDSNYPVNLYGVTFTSYKEASSNRNVGNIAFHGYPTNWLRSETLGQMAGGNGYNILGGRQAIIFDIGWLKIKGAGEYLQQTNEKVGSPEKFRRWGAGGGVQIILNPYVEFGANGAYADVRHVDQSGALDGGGTFTLVSYGAFANARLFIDDLILGIGINRVDKDDKKVESTTQLHGEFAHMQTFAALQYLLAKQLFLKLVVGYAETYQAPTFAQGLKYNNDFTSIRLRATYLF
jgi:hypothetical protein